MNFHVNAAWSAFLSAKPPRDMRLLRLLRRFDGVLAWDSFFHLRPDDQPQMFNVFAPFSHPRAHRGTVVASIFCNRAPGHMSAVGQKPQCRAGATYVRYSPAADGRCVVRLRAT